MHKLLTTQQAADHLKVSYSTLNRWRALGLGPAFIRVGKQPRYRVCDLDDYLENHKIEPSD